VKYHNGKCGLTGKRSDRCRFCRQYSSTTGGQVHRAIQGEAFDAEQYDKERAERYRRRVGFY